MLESLTINQLLTVFTWFPLAALLAIMLLIARFYQNLTGESTHYVWFIVPIILYGIAAAYAASTNQVMGSFVGDLVFFLAGVVLVFLCAGLYRQMTAGR